MCVQKLHAHYVLRLLEKTLMLMRLLPNINHVSTCKYKEITICGENTHLNTQSGRFFKYFIMLCFVVRRRSTRTSGRFAVDLLQSVSIFPHNFALGF